jgi:Cysteine-rich secretory protein family
MDTRRFRPVAAAAAAIAATAAAVAAAPTAHAATAQQTIALLNAQRSANGLPADLTEDPRLTSACAAHDRYMALNHTLTHFEQPGKPGYSVGGAYAGKNAVLSHRGSWDNGNPYESAPIHLDQLLAPRLTSIGSADLDGYSCTTTYPGWTRADPPTPTVYTYPGNGSVIYPSEVAREAPWTPGELVGIPQPRRTGPYLFVFVDAPRQSPFSNPATLTDATLAGATGPVAVKVADGNTPVPSGGTLGPYLYPGGFIVPVKPLTPGATYRAHVLVNFGGAQTAHDWSFVVSGGDPHSKLSAKHGRLTFTSQSPQPIEVTFTRSGGRHASPVTIRPGASVRLSLSPGSWQACGHQPATDVYAGYDRCVAIIVTGVPKLQLSRGTQHGAQVRFTVSYSAVLRGRSATETITPVSNSCVGNACTPIPGHPTSRTIVLNARTLSVPLPPPGHGVELALSTSGFQLRDAP